MVKHICCLIINYYGTGNNNEHAFIRMTRKGSVRAAKYMFFVNNHVTFMVKTITELCVQRQTYLCLCLGFAS